MSQKYVDSHHTLNRYHVLHKFAISDTRNRSFQCKAYHYILPKKAMLQHIIIQSTEQIHSGENVEKSLEHILVNFFSKLSWSELGRWISQNLDEKLKSSIQEQLFGTLLENNSINQILNLARKHMSYKGQNEVKLCMNAFLHYPRKSIK